MIIYPLPAQELDDASLSKQIRNIAQVLCGVHFNICKLDVCDHYDLGFYFARMQTQNKYTEWCQECRANYLKLVEMGINCCVEYNMRFNDYKEWMKWKCEDSDTPHCTNHHKLEHVIFWARDNNPFE